MAYDLNAKVDEAIKLLEENPKIVTDLQVYGRIGVGADYFYEKVIKHEKAETIRALLNKNRCVYSNTCTDNLQIAAEEGNVKAMETLGRIVDKQILEALAPQYKKEEEDKDQKLSKEEMIAEVMRVLSDFK